MKREANTGSAVELARRYLRQMREAGEDELVVSPETAALVGRRTKPRAGSAAKTARGERRPVARAASRKSDAARSEPVRADATPAVDAPAADSVRAKAAALPDVDVIEIRLALGPREDARDMFVEESAVDRCADLASVSKLASACESCELASTRTNVVFGAGSESADLMFIGEGPGRNEDLEGVPFVGRAGELLNKILDAAEFERDAVYIANIIKCRPPNNRTPLTSEIEACVPFLARQIALIAPRIICTLGLPATQTLLGTKGSMASMRGKVYQHGDIKVIPTYHPAAALRDPKYKRPMWEDFLRIRKEYDRG